MRATASNLLRLAAYCAVAAAILIAGCGEKRDAITKVAIKETVKEAYIYGFPLLMNYGVMREYFVDHNSGQFKAPFNTIYNEARVFTPQDTAVVTPDSETSYSWVGLDLRAEPIVLCVPEVEKRRYYSVQLVDMYTFSYGYIGSRVVGNDAGCYAVAGPDWKGAIPTEIKWVFRSETQFGMAIYRTQLLSPSDIPNVEKVQAGYKVQPLSQFLNQPAPPAPPAIDFVPFTRDDLRTRFVKYLNFILQFCPTHEAERALREKFATIGIEPGKPFDFYKLSEAHKGEMMLGINEGSKAIEKKKDDFTKIANGWLVEPLGGDRAFFKGDFLLRAAAAAAAGIYGNSGVEVVSSVAKHDSNDEPLDASKHNYTMTFAAGELPPVHAFWSLTMYDAQTRLLIENPIGRYLISSPMLPQLKKNADGSLTLYLQKDSPGNARESNWLPAPEGPIYVVMRLYWPKKESPSVLPLGDGTWKPPAIVPAS
jgi:hypothetical protein